MICLIIFYNKGQLLDTYSVLKILSNDIVVSPTLEEKCS